MPENTFQLTAYLESLLPVALSFLAKLLFCLLLWFIGKKLIRLILKLIRRSGEQHQWEPTVARFLESLIKWGLYALLAYVMFEIMGGSSSSLLAIFTSAGLTLGLALQGSLSNFAGGVLILLLKPFRVGDYIIDGSSSSEGTVHSIDLFYTTLITIDNRVVVIPNGALSNSSLVNVTSRKERLLILSVGVAYSTELKKAKEVILRCAALTQGTVINEEKPVRVIVDTLGDSSIVLQVRVWVETSQYLSAKSDLNEKIIDAFREENISIPFPQLDVHMQ